jgi:3-oxoacyl-[acyl-carrier protein] reductase
LLSTIRWSGHDGKRLSRDKQTRAGDGPVCLWHRQAIRASLSARVLLRDQVAIVTGGGRGIGRAIALRFAEAGADVAVFDIDGSTAKGTVEAVRALGRRGSAYTVDVCDHGAVAAAVQDLAAELGRIDVLVNNAGVETRSSFLEITPGDWERQLAVNLTGTFNCSQAAGREMARRGYGRIVNISSVAGLFGPIDLAAYGAAKAGIVGLTRAAALDLADFGITVNAIAPGPIETELMLGVWSAEALRERPQHGAIARFGTVDEIAHAALFLASADSGFITGVTLPVDGGAARAPTWSRSTAAGRRPPTISDRSGDIRER